MKTRLLKKLTLVFALFAATSMSAQLFTFDTSLKGWADGFTPASNGTPVFVAGAGELGSGALKLTRLSNNANFGYNTVPNPGIDGTTKKYIKIRYRNETLGTNFRVQGNSVAGVIAQTTFTIAAGTGAVGSGTWTTAYLNMTGVTNWSSDVNNLDILLRLNWVSGEAGSLYVGSVEFLDSIPAPTLDGIVQNPGFEDLDGNITPWSPATQTFATIATTNLDKHAGTYSLKHTYSAAPTVTHFVFNNYVHDLVTSTSDYIKASMWVKVVRPSTPGVSPLIEIQGQGRTGTTLVVNALTTVTDVRTTTKTDGTWEKVNFTFSPAAPYSTAQFRYGIQVTNLLAGDIVYVDDISASRTAGSTWNGTNWSDEGAPSTSMGAIIAGPYDTTTYGGFTANKLTVNSGSLTINTGTSVTVTNEVINNAGANGIVIQNNANLIQTNNVANTGNVVVNRNSSPLLRLDYTLWSSPVTGVQTLADFSPLTSQSPSRFYSFDTTFNTGGVNGAYSVINTPTSTTFALGKGYLIRMPNNADAGTPTAYPGVFTGTPNNGNVSVTLVDGAVAGLRYNLVGNPYPSTIKMQNFVFDNTANIESTLYFWRKTNGAGSAYCTWTAGALVTDPGTFVTNGNAQSVDPANIIQTGQGFFVEAKSGATTVTFNNGQRIANNAGQFFKTKQVVDAGRVWLNATNAAGDFSQMAVTYSDQATLGVDRYDGKFINDSKFALTSNINNEEYTIQGRPAFDASDVVALNFKAENAGTYTIAKDHADGVFAAGQDVYLVDATTGTETNLQTDAYTFTATAGVDNARFSLKYQKTLGVNANTFNDNSVTVYRNSGTINVTSGANAISSIKVYDIQGRVIAEQKNVNANTATVNNLKASNQVLLVKVTSADNSVVTKKVIN